MQLCGCAAWVFGLLNEQRLYATSKFLEKAKVFRRNGLERRANQYRSSRTETVMAECGCRDDGSQGFGDDELRCLVGKESCLEGNTCLGVRVPVAVANNTRVGQTRREQQVTQPRLGFATSPR